MGNEESGFLPPKEGEKGEILQSQHHGSHYVHFHNGSLQQTAQNHKFGSGRPLVSSTMTTTKSPPSSPVVANGPGGNTNDDHAAPPPSSRYSRTTSRRRPSHRAPATKREVENPRSSAASLAVPKRTKNATEAHFDDMDELAEKLRSRRVSITSNDDDELDIADVVAKAAGYGNDAESKSRADGVAPMEITPVGTEIKQPTLTRNSTSSTKLTLLVKSGGGGGLTRNGNSSTSLNAQGGNPNILKVEGGIDTSAKDPVKELQRLHQERQQRQSKSPEQQPVLQDITSPMPPPPPPPPPKAQSHQPSSVQRRNLSQANRNSLPGTGNARVRKSNGNYAPATTPVNVMVASSNPTFAGSWSNKEDELLKQAVDKHGQSWKQVAGMIPGKTAQQCQIRYGKVFRPGFRKGTWTPEEDAQLIQLVQEMPKRNWGDIASLIKGRSAKQCRERWCYNLDPSINKNAWTPEEDQTLIKAQTELGNRWAHIASLLPGRTENAVKTRFKSIMRAKKREWHPEEDELILRMHQQLGSRWEVIASKLPNRTKNAVKTRFRLLGKGLAQKAPEVGAPNQTLRQPGILSPDVQEHLSKLNSDPKYNGGATDDAISSSKKRAKSSDGKAIANETASKSSTDTSSASNTADSPSRSKRSLSMKASRDLSKNGNGNISSTSENGNADASQTTSPMQKPISNRRHSTMKKAKPGNGSLKGSRTDLASLDLSEQLSIDQSDILFHPNGSIPNGGISIYDYEDALNLMGSADGNDENKFPLPPPPPPPPPPPHVPLDSSAAQSTASVPGRSGVVRNPASLTSLDEFVGTIVAHDTRISSNVHDMGSSAYIPPTPSTTSTTASTSNFHSSSEDIGEENNFITSEPGQPVDDELIDFLDMWNQGAVDGIEMQNS